MKSIKEIVQKRIKQNGLTMNEFTDLIGISRTAIYKLFDENSTSIATLEKIAEVLKMSVTEFFEDSMKIEDPQSGYTVIKNEELIELQKLALGNIKRELEQSKNIKDVSFEDGIDVIIP